MPGYAPVRGGPSGTYLACVWLHALAWRIRPTQLSDGNRQYYVMVRTKQTLIVVTLMQGSFERCKVWHKA